MLPSSVIHHLRSKKHHNEKPNNPASTSHFFMRHSYLSKIDLVEDTLRALALLLPGRFEDADLCSQSVLTILNLVSCYHTDCLINKSVKHLLHETDSFNRHFYQQDKCSKTISWVLSVISYTEVLAEMVVRRKLRATQAYKRWIWITTIESLKAILRIMLLYVNKKRMLLYPTHPIRNVDTCSLKMDVDGKYELLTLDPRNGTALSHVAEPSDANSKREQDAGSDHASNFWSTVSEILWIVRPLVYVIMTLLQHRRQQRRLIQERSSDVIYRHPQPTEKEADTTEVSEDDDDDDDEEGPIEKEEEALSWKPWVVSLCIDLLSKLTRRATTALEKDEARRRDYLLIYYLFRGPVYMALTRNLLERFCNATEHRPLFSVITAAINDYRPFWEDTYFYTAGS